MISRAQLFFRPAYVVKGVQKTPKQWIKVAYNMNTIFSRTSFEGIDDLCSNERTDSILAVPFENILFNSVHVYQVILNIKSKVGR